MTLILTNDDGVDAPGLQALAKALDGKGMIVAPQKHVSGCGHQVTTTSPIHIQRRSETEFAIAGTPADCVRVALSHLCQDVQWVFSGINAGANLGVDAYISGTVAAVREAAFHHIPGVAVSHYRKGKREISWEVAARWTAKVLAELRTHPLASGSFWNVNLPHLEPGEPDPEVVFCKPSTQPLPLQYRLEDEHLYYVGDYAKRDRAPGTDVDVCFSGQIAVTQVCL